MEELFQNVAEKCKKGAFLENVMEKAHYMPEDRELLWSVLEQILKCMEEGAAWSGRELCGRDAMSDAREDGRSDGREDAPSEAREVALSNVREVVMTLGAGVDELQERFLREGRLTEGYMVEVLGSEILLCAYGIYNAWVKDRGDSVVRRYYFLGTESDSPENGQKSGKSKESEEAEKGRKAGKAGLSLRLGLQELPKMLERSGLPVTCTGGYCMVPKKSVAFYAELSPDRTVVCEGLCMGCGRKDCPNRMDSGSGQRANRFLDHPLTYGYARIFGL